MRCPRISNLAVWICPCTALAQVFFGQTDAPDTETGGCKWVTDSEEWNSAEDDFDRLCVKDTVDMACTA